MDMKRIAIGTIVGGVALYAISYLIFDLAFGSYYAANVGSASGALRTPNFQWALAITNFAGALMVTLALELKGNTPSIANGFIMGAVIGFLVWVQADFYYYGATNIWRYVIVIVDPLLSALDTGIGGAIIAAVLARVPRSAGLQPAR
jgi:hypothetical protein